MPRAPAPVWKHFLLQDCKQKAKCLHCDQVYSCKGGTTTSLLNHLKTYHDEPYKQIQEESKGKPNKFVEAKLHKQTKITTMCQPTGEKLQQQVDEAMVDFLADSGVSLRIVELESFQNLLKIANTKINIKSRKAYTKMINKKGDELRKEIIGIIDAVKEDVKYISFTTDAWTSISGDQFLSLTIQFIDQDWKLHCFTPYVRPFPTNHTRKNISICFDGMIEELGLDGLDWTLFSVNDNAAKGLGLTHSEVG